MNKSLRDSIRKSIERDNSVWKEFYDRFPVPEGAVIGFDTLRNYVNSNQIPVDDDVTIKKDIKFDDGAIIISTGDERNLPETWCKLYFGATKFVTHIGKIRYNPVLIVYISQFTTEEMPFGLQFWIAEKGKPNEVVRQTMPLEQLGVISNKRWSSVSLFRTEEEASVVTDYT